MDTLVNVAIFLIILNCLVFVHELGHFLAARLARIQVDEFALGFPPRLVGVVRTPGGQWRWLFGPRTPKPAELGGPCTIYSLNLLPIGGFVRLAGEDDPSTPGGMASAPKRARAAVLLAGPAFNLLFAFLVFLVGFHVGWPDRVNILGVEADSPAIARGVQVGDVVLTANGQTIHYREQLTQITYASLGRPVELVVDRQGQTVELSVTPRTQWPEDQGPMGIQLGQAVIVQYAWPQAGVRAAEEVVYQINYLLRLPGRILRQELPAEAARPCGPVCMNDLTREAVEFSQAIDAWFPVIQLIGLISIALGFTNLLPLPALDGGRLVFVLLEALRRRRLDPAREGAVHLVGLAMLLVLMIFITYQDIAHPIIPR